MGNDFHKNKEISANGFFAPRVIYSAESQLRRPTRLMSEMGRDLVVSFKISRQILLYRLRSQYRQARLGYLWILVPPLFLSLIFIFLRYRGIVNNGAVENYPAFAAVGIWLWYVFVDAVSIPFKVGNSFRRVMAKVNFPRETLIIASIAEVVFNLLVRFAVLLVVLVLLGVPVTFSALLVMPGVAAMIMLGTSIGMILSPIALLHHDIERGLPIAISTLLLITPIGYPISSSGRWDWVTDNNPIAVIVTATRELFFYGETSDWPKILLISVILLVVIAISWLWYRLSVPYVNERLGS